MRVALLQTFFLPLARKNIAVHMEAVQLLMDMHHAHPLPHAEATALQFLAEGSQEEEEPGDLVCLRVYRLRRCRVNGVC